MLRRPLLLAMAAAAFAVALPCSAQTFPDRPIKLVVGFPPGTGPDIVARTLGQKLGELLKQNVIVDNRAGAGGQIGAQAVAKSAPDGYTLLLGEVGSISIAPQIYSKLPYDPVRELVPVSEVVRSDFVMLVPGTSTARDVKGFVAAARGQSQRINFATFGAGTPGHFGAELLAEQGGFKIEPIHFKATGDAITSLVAADSQAAFVTTALAVAQVKSGKIRALATTAGTRSALLPDVPTFAESELPKVDFSAWFAVFAPAGTPAPILDALNRAVVAAIQSPEAKTILQDAGFTIRGSSRVDTERMLKAEGARWAAVAKATGFRAD